MEIVIKTAFSPGDRIWMPDGSGGREKGRITRIMIMRMVIKAEETQKAMNKIEGSINFIRKYATLADKYGGYTVCFSGGKDSQVMLDLFQKSGVKFHAVYNVTTNDPPENVYFIREHYPKVEFIHSKLTYLQLIERNRMLPLMSCRFCCSKLKEKYGHGFVAVGVRKEESAKRAKYPPIAFSNNKTFDELKLRKNRKVIFRPILEWTEADIWQYIADNGIPINPCYKHSGRVGCLFCPYASTRALQYAAEHYPRHHRLLMRTIQRIIDNGYFREYAPVSASDVWGWWISKKSAAEYFGNK